MSDLDHHLDAICAGDPKAFAAWVAGAEAPIRRSLFSFATRLDTEAIVQETLLRCWQVAPRFTPDGRPNSFYRLALRVARNLAISETRRRRAEPVDDATLERAMADAMSVEPALVDPHLRDIIAQCHQQLPKQPGRALLARLAADGTRSDHTVAHGLKMRLNTFLQNITRARKLLAKCLSRHGVEFQTEDG